jgi:hypothetical protein
MYLYLVLKMPVHIENIIFKNLVEKYPTWEELQAFLESDEGGQFKIIEKGNENGLRMIRYEKGVTKMDLPHSKWFRSVVWNIKSNRPVCVAPPKAASEEFPYRSFQEVLNVGVVCQELMEGFMINCFKVVGDETLYITSRSKLDATGKFYSEKSFRQMFQEAYMNSTEFTEQDFETKSAELASPNTSNGELAVFYSFLVQHTEHRIVKKNAENRAVMIHRGTVYDDGRVLIEDGTTLENITLESKQKLGSYASIVTNGVGKEEVSEVQKWIKNYLTEKDWQFQGLVFKDNLGNRWRYRSEKYSTVKALRGNSSSVKERFAQLYTQNLVYKYLEYYDEEMLHMTGHMMAMSLITKMLYDNYVDLHITKVKKSEEIDKVFLPHLYSIHGIFLTQLRPVGKKININEITLYLHRQPWQRILFLINKVFNGLQNGAI